MLVKSNVKVPFNFNFFEKYWENVISFMSDLVGWSVESELKNIRTDNIIECFAIL